MTWHPADANATLAVDAVSIYATFAPGNDVPYASVASLEVSLWQMQAATGLNVVPTLTPNMDPRWVGCGSVGAGVSVLPAR
jgi:hypothetical protein